MATNRPFWKPRALKLSISKNSTWRALPFIAMVILLSELHSKQKMMGLYLNSLKALAFGQHGHRIPDNDYAIHYILVLDLTRTQQASHVYLYPGLIKGFISSSLRFSAQLTNSVEVLSLGERVSTIYIDSSRKVSKNFFLNTKPETKRWWIVPKFYYKLRSVVPET